MDGNSSRGSLWFEDLERHRQPCLYYLSSEDDGGGPHLVCDWNGPPTDFKEFDFDFVRRRIDATPDVPSPNDKIPAQDKSAADYDEREFSPERGPSFSLLTENDGARLDLLTVPPIVNSLMLRMFQEHKKDSRPKPAVDKQTNSSERRHIVKKTGRPLGRPLKKDKDLNSSAQQQNASKNNPARP